jgi:hypothetical protein
MIEQEQQVASWRRVRRLTASGDAIANLTAPGVAVTPDGRVGLSSGGLDAFAGTFLRSLAPLARPWLAGLVALLIYLVRAAAVPGGLARTKFAFFNYLADAFLHGQFQLRLQPWSAIDLVKYDGRLYLYWPPFPAVLATPLVALFGVEVSDVVFTAAIAALSVALVAKLLAALDEAGVAPLDAGRRGLLVATVAFGSVLLFVATEGGVWVTSQAVGWCCTVLASVAALTRRDRWGYFLAGLALAAATSTRLGLLVGGTWLAYYLPLRDRERSLLWRLSAAALALAPLLGALLVLGWYNYARFGDPLELGIRWHTMHPIFRADFERYGYLSLHYLPTNLYHHFLAPPLTRSQNGLGGGLFWMTPVFLGALRGLWSGRRDGLVWALALSCLLLYVPSGLVMGTGYLFGSRYLLDLFVPLLALTAIGVRRWRPPWLLLAFAIGCGIFLLGSAMFLVVDYQQQYIR